VGTVSPFAAPRHPGAGNPLERTAEQPRPFLAHTATTVVAAQWSMRARAVVFARSREPTGPVAKRRTIRRCGPRGSRATIAFHICDVLMKHLVE
jgi:hypothetical protein